jgi:hypothetical protein
MVQSRWNARAGEKWRSFYVHSELTGGQEVMNKRISSPTISVNCSELANGVYHYVITGEGTNKKGKILIE